MAPPSPSSGPWAKAKDVKSRNAARIAQMVKPGSTGAAGNGAEGCCRWRLSAEGTFGRQPGAGRRGEVLAAARPKPRQRVRVFRRRLRRQVEGQMR